MWPLAVAVSVVLAAISFLAGYHLATMGTPTPGTQVATQPAPSTASAALDSQGPSASQQANPVANASQLTIMSIAARTFPDVGLQAFIRITRGPPGSPTPASAEELSQPDLVVLRLPPDLYSLQGWSEVVAVMASGVDYSAPIGECSTIVDLSAGGPTTLVMTYSPTGCTFVVR